MTPREKIPRSLCRRLQKSLDIYPVYELRARNFGVFMTEDLSTIKVRQSRKDFSLKSAAFNEKLKFHVFAFELVNPSFKQLHDSVHEDLEFYRFAVGLGPVFVERYYYLMRERISLQTQDQHDEVTELFKQSFHHKEEFYRDSVVRSFDNSAHISVNK